jgi:hypothetical protein
MFGGLRHRSTCSLVTSPWELFNRSVLGAARSCNGRAIENFCSDAADKDVFSKQADRGFALDIRGKLT